MKNQAILGLIGLSYFRRTSKGVCEVLKRYQVFKLCIHIIYRSLYKFRFIVAKEQQGIMPNSSLKENKKNKRSKTTLFSKERM